MHARNGVSSRLLTLFVLVSVINQLKIIKVFFQIDKCLSILVFQLINHGVDDSLVNKVKEGIQGLFNLPMEEKSKYWQRPEEMEGFGQAFVVSEEQKLDWGDIFYMITLPKHARKPYLFPMLPQPLRSSLALSRFHNSLSKEIFF